MSRPLLKTSDSGQWLLLALLAGAGGCAAADTVSSAPMAPAASAPGLTIADLTAAQRAVIDAEVRRTVARARGLPESPANALPPAGAPLVPALPALPAATLPAAPIPLAAPGRLGAPGAAPVAANLPDDRIAVTGQAHARGAWRAEVVTDRGAYLLAAGQPIPGTQWLVASVEPGRVTLRTRDRRARPNRRVVELGAGAGL